MGFKKNLLRNSEVFIVPTQNEISCPNLTARLFSSSLNYGRENILRDQDEKGAFWFD